MSGTGADPGGSREFSRLEPLPEMFGLSAGDTAASALHGRVAFVALRDTNAAAIVVAGLSGSAADRAVVVHSDLFATGLDEPWAAFQLPSDVGLAQLLTPSEFLTSLRRLADDLLLPAAGSGVLIDASSAHANETSVRTIRSLFPDALVVVDPDLAVALPAYVRSTVIAWNGGDVPSLPEPGSIGSAAAKAGPDDPMRDRLLLIVGCGRSGTTWLQQLCLTHPDIAGLPHHESWLFQQLGHLWANHARPDALRQWVDDDTFVRALRRHCDDVLDRARRRCGGADHDFFVEKTPLHAERLDQISRVYPDAWVVHLVRDGRAVARSMVDVPFFDVPDLATAAALWNRTIAAVRAAQPSVRRFRDISYEQLRADPASQLRALWQWLGLAPLPDDDHQLSDAVATPVSAHRHQRQRRPLSREDLATIYRHAGGSLRREGYVSRATMLRSRLAGSIFRGTGRR